MLGNLAVRDYRGASGNVAIGGTVNPTRNRKSEIGNPPPKAGRARILSQWGGSPASGSIWSTGNRRNRLISTEGGSFQGVARAVGVERLKHGSVSGSG